MRTEPRAPSVAGHALYEHDARGRSEPLAFGRDQRFAVVARIGAGGMGVVYEAFDRQRRERVALKTLRAIGPDALLRFKREFRSLQGIAHPNLVGLHELVVDESAWFFTMELVEGVDIVEHVRGEPLRRERTVTQAPLDSTPAAAFVGRPARAVPIAVDEATVRAAFVQLARGLAALHAAGKVHRDVKPSNTRVTEAGRVVILDFGLVEDWDDPTAAAGPLAGTIAYMAPEQAGGVIVGPAADWYGFGVVLYEALTGRVPFEGAPAEIIARKRAGAPPPPRAFCPDVAPDLEELCMDLLSRTPSVRPRARDVLERLCARSTERPSADIVTPAPDAPDCEALAALTRAATDSRRGAGVTVLVRGAARAGKSALVSSFLAREAAGEPAVIHLRSRCDARELVPYRAIDGIIDGLSALVRRDGPSSMRPPAAELLARTFPVVRELAPCEGAALSPNAASPAIDARDGRRRLFEEARRWIARVAEHRPVVVFIDDFELADADSVALLRHVMAAPAAPRVLVIIAERTPSDAPRGAPIESGWCDLRVLPVEGLPSAAAPTDADARAALGRLDRLDPAAERLFAVIAVAAGPLRVAAAARASGLDGEPLSRSIEALRRAHLVQAGSLHGAAVLEPFAAPLGAAFASRLDHDSRAALHATIARAIHQTAADADAELEAIEWQSAGDDTRAAAAALRAARAAEDALAFGRAARLYAMALQCGSFDGEERQRHLLRRAAALTNAGRGVEAARTYVEAAASFPAASALPWKRLAAELYLSGGFVAEGLATLDDVLGAIGMRIPASPLEAAASVAVRRAQLLARGLAFRERSARHIPDAELARVDVCRAAAQGLGFVDNIRAAHFQALHTLYALRAGDAERLTRAAAMEAPFFAAMGRRGARRARELVVLAETLAQRRGDPYLCAIAQFAAGFSALQQGRWAPARAFIDRASAALAEHCAGAGWELFTSRISALWSLFYLGELAELSNRADAVIRDALDYGNLYASTNARLGVVVVAWLARDDAERARREVASALDAWPAGRYDAQHCFALIANLHIDLYLGDGATGHARICAEWRALGRSLFLHNQLIRVTMLHLRAATALALASSTRDRDVLASAERDARRLEGERAPWAAALARLVRAGAAYLRGERSKAVDLLAVAALELAEAQMPLYAAAAEARLGALIGGARGQALGARARERFLSERVAAPDRLIRMLAPGLPA